MAHHHNVTTFADAFPDADAEIGEILNDRPKGFPVYLVSKHDLGINDDAWKIIKEYKI